ncbi:hypothetical protein CDD80_6608 [Ophiocordyceps camponoti-rufipedis]|uniref:non-specific serine/threonine protein kinase n=1 Tax=Ophiocordyceps camponoti-rufipedis TaxID=2004952 RepID=A0A2C5YLH9_9HYPO|nr:hypothetical protein CDD80_6608 [Ophiocordyceps camponoti-rufipedis]
MSGGDLSLSQALGGLRIANPDDSSSQQTSSEFMPAPSSSTSAENPVFSRSTIPAPRPNSQLRDTLMTSKQFSTCSLPVVGQSRASHSNESGNNIFAASTSSPRPSSVHRQLDERGLSRLSRQTMMPSETDSCRLRRRNSGDVRTGDDTPALITPDIQSAFAGAPTPLSAEDWKDRGAAIGVRRELDSQGRAVVRHVKKGVRDFSFGRILGEGSYSTVYHATDRQTLKEYAIKVLEKRHIIKEKKIKYVNIEKNTLNRLTEHQGVVRLYYTFQDETSLYYVLDLCNGGELLGVLKKTGTFDVACARFYGAQILDSIDYMHSRGVVHRDLKPENVLLDDHMHIKITDFGTARLLRDPRETMINNALPGPLPDPDAGEVHEHSRAASFVGTAEYVSPELLTHKTASKASDLWAYGCIIYQMLAGRPPFKAASEYLTFQKIVNLEYEFPSTFPSTARDLVERCLVLDPDRRLTTEHIRNHEFFHGQQFGGILWRTKAPRLRPYAPPAPEHIATPNDELSAEVSAALSAPVSRKTHQSSGNLASNNRPPRIITELPPPTQLDIEWSPVLTRTNERILKLGDLNVSAVPQPNINGAKALDDGHKKLSRFFGGTTTKKRHRLVIITTSGRIILAPAGGEEKRSKLELSLLSPHCSWSRQLDAKGQAVWVVSTDGHHYTFEEPKVSFSSQTCHSSAEEWIACLEKSRGLALACSSAPRDEEPILDEVPSTLSTPSSTPAGSVQYGADPPGQHDRSMRNHLSKSQTANNEVGSSSKRNRFSKRQSRTGTGPVF